MFRIQNMNQHGDAELKQTRPKDERQHTVPNWHM